MTDKNLAQYIQQARNTGVSDGEIKKNLLENGWQGQDIDVALQVISISSTPTPKKRWKKRVVGALIIVITVLMGLWSFPWIASMVTSDIPPIDDSDLRLSKVNVPDAENAYFDLIKIKPVLYWPDDRQKDIASMVAGEMWDEALAQEVISRNKEALEYFADASKKPKFQDPAAADPSQITPNTILPPLNSFRSISSVSALRAQDLARKGNGRESLEEAFKSVAVGQKIEESQGALIEYLVGMAIKSNGLKTIQFVAGAVPVNELVAYRDILNTVYENEEGLIAAFKNEYQMGVWSLNEIDANGFPFAFAEDAEDMDIPDFLKGQLGGFYFRKNETQALAAEFTRSQVENIKRVCSTLQDIEVRKVAPPTWRAYITENALGMMLYDVVSSSFNTLHVKRCDEDARVAATQTIIGIEAFRKDTGDYPQSLSELIPQYLPSVPLDPYDDTPFKFIREKNIVYSVGRDKVDSSGNSQHGEGPSDLVFSFGLIR